tara:strand:+ start:2954 stop:3589 length:636 start_codon:yes stop_codon:yes gene_type:complete
MNKRDVIVKIIGVLFLFYGLFAIGFSVYRGKPDWIFWFCYIAMTLIGIGALKKDGKLIAAQLNIVAAYLLAWNIDFFYQFITGKPLWGVTDYFFGELLVLARLISIEHFFLLPLGLYLLYEIKLEKGHLKLAILEGTLIYVLTIILTDPKFNVNCAFKSCVPFIPTNSFYQIIWYALTLITIIIVAFIINKVPAFHEKKQTKVKIKTKPQP